MPAVLRFETRPLTGPATDKSGSSGLWRSLVARFVWDEDVAGSNPVSPTKFFYFVKSQDVSLHDPADSVSCDFTRGMAGG